MTQFENAVERFGKLILNELKDAGITCWIAGGSVRDYFMGVFVKTDYDIFFPSEIEYQKCATFFKTKKAEIIFENENGMKVNYNNRKYDLVKHFFENPSATIDAFDFTVSMFAVDSEKVYHGETSFIDLAKRQLMINKITYPASTMKRAFRYYTKGFRMCAGEMKKIAEALIALPTPEPQNTEEENVPSGDDNDTFFTGID